MIGLNRCTADVEVSVLKRTRADKRGSKERKEILRKAPRAHTDTSALAVRPRQHPEPGADQGGHCVIILL